MLSDIPELSSGLQPLARCLTWANLENQRRRRLEFQAVTSQPTTVPEPGSRRRRGRRRSWTVRNPEPRSCDLDAHSRGKKPGHRALVPGSRAREAGRSCPGCSCLSPAPAGPDGGSSDREHGGRGLTQANARLG